ncbi:hypothetical protein CCYA_CCYA15G3892 [Cyanidiococcus yangmingshanensis]|nr:hypothetical protein CCYA_CCYA15G3892 [Cyanidiococcus yangmingshanensis]
MDAGATAQRFSTENVDVKPTPGRSPTHRRMLQRSLQASNKTTRQVSKSLDEQFRKYQRKFQGKNCYVDPEMPSFWAQAARRAIRAYGARLQPYFDAALYCIVTHRGQDDLSPWLERARRWRIHLLHCMDSRVQQWIRIGERASESVAEQVRAQGLGRGTVAPERSCEAYWQAFPRQSSAPVSKLGQTECRATRSRQRHETVLAAAGERSVSVGTDTLVTQSGALYQKEEVMLTPAVREGHVLKTLDQTAETLISNMTPNIAAFATPGSTATATTTVVSKCVGVPGEEPTHAGFCELCGKRFQHYAEHLKSEEHRRYVRCIDWQPLDSLAMAIYTVRLKESTTLARAIAASAPVSPISSRDSSMLSETASKPEEMLLLAKASPHLKGITPATTQTQSIAPNTEMHLASRIGVE